jgi:hypothetical protein
MTFAALVLAQVFRLTVPHLLNPAPPAADAARYRLADFADSVEQPSLPGPEASRYRLAEFVASVESQALSVSDSARYHASEFADAVERDVERCICTTTRLSPATLKAEILLVSDCECGN